jgi:dienelactone hydrolase
LEAKILSNSLKAVTRGTRLPDKFRMLPQRARRMALLLLAALLPLYALAAAGVQAAMVEIHTGGRAIATADYRPGKPDKPAVQVLHGFLQTREFGIASSIADTLADEGYTVLAPNLSLGISSRKSSLDCEALHLHDMEGDLGEIQQWMQWLRERGHRKIIGIGHSFGATQLLAWREQYREKGFPLIAISLVSSAPLAVEAPGNPAARPPAAQKVQGALTHAPLSFCRGYTAPADKYASYLRWDEHRTLAALRYAANRTDIILGGEDKYLPPEWAARLAKTGARVRLLNGASHFMDGTQEFDMLDAILGILKR